MGGGGLSFLNKKSKFIKGQLTCCPPQHLQHYKASKDR